LLSQVHKAGKGGVPGREGGLGGGRRLATEKRISQNDNENVTRASHFLITQHHEHDDNDNDNGNGAVVASGGTTKTRRIVGRLHLYKRPTTGGRSSWEWRGRPGSVSNAAQQKEPAEGPGAEAGAASATAATATLTTT